MLPKHLVGPIARNSAVPTKLPLHKLLGSDPEGSPVKETWKYSSVVGRLLYLSTNTRPEIAFAVSQVAQFNSNPKQSHASAVKMIIRYLSATSDKGITFPLPLISRLIVMWMQTLLDYMVENLRML